MRKLTAISALIILAGCAQLDEATGTSFAERCVAYRAALAGLEASQVRDPSDARAARIASYKALVDTCP